MYLGKTRDQATAMPPAEVPVSGPPARRRLTDLAEPVGWVTNQQVKRYLSADWVA